MLGSLAQRLSKHRDGFGLDLGAFGEMLVDALDQVHRLENLPGFGCGLLHKRKAF
jgi:hypothetical protein